MAFLGCPPPPKKICHLTAWHSLSPPLDHPDGPWKTSEGPKRAGLNSRIYRMLLDLNPWRRTVTCFFLSFFWSGHILMNNRLQIVHSCKICTIYTRTVVTDRVLVYIWADSSPFKIIVAPQSEIFPGAPGPSLGELKMVTGWVPAWHWPPNTTK